MHYQYYLIELSPGVYLDGWDEDGEPEATRIRKAAWHMSKDVAERRMSFLRNFPLAKIVRASERKS